MINTAIQKAIQALGSQQKLASAVGIKQPNVWCWLHNKKRVSPENVNAIVEATGGLVKAYEFDRIYRNCSPTRNRTLKQ